MKYICLLRAVNVSGHNVIKKDALIEVFEKLGYDDVKTYIQSGNILFDAPRGKHAAKIEAALAKVGVDTTAILRTPAELQKIAAVDPWPQAAGNRRHVLFLDSTTTAKPDAPTSNGEEVRYAGREIYMHLPNGSARSKLNPKWFEKATDRKMTARNWNTLLKLIELAGA